MKRISILLFSLMAIGVFSCSSSRRTDSTPPKKMINRGESVSLSQLEVGVPLEDYLRTVPGVMVSGGGQNATVRIRGIANSFNMDSSPLFVLNGQPIGTSFQEVHTAVNIFDIDRVEVVKGASATGAYGVRGNNGVIEIYTKTK